MSRQLRLLVVDDECPVAAIVEKALRRRHDTVLLAGSIGAARRLVETARDPLDIAVIDLTLPDGDGLAYAGELHRQYPEIRIILTTGGNDPLVADFGFLRKPFTIDELWATVAA